MDSLTLVTTLVILFLLGYYVGIQHKVISPKPSYFKKIKIELDG